MGRPRKVKPIIVQPAVAVVPAVAAVATIVEEIEEAELASEDKLTMEDIREIFRDNLLEALDFSANEAFGIPDSGAKDRDLPPLFAALDVQIETLIKRHKVEVKK